MDEWVFEPFFQYSCYSDTPKIWDSLDRCIDVNNINIETDVSDQNQAALFVDQIHVLKLNMFNARGLGPH